MKISFLYSLLLVLSICQLHSQTVPADSLFDFDANFQRVIQAYQGDDPLLLARLGRDANLGLNSCALFAETAGSYAALGQLDSAAYYFKKAIEQGLINPNYKGDNPDLAKLEESEYWPDLADALAKTRADISDIEKFRFDFSNIPRFFTAWNEAKANPDQAEVAFKKFILEGNAAIRDFYVLRYNSPKRMAKVSLETAPNYYAYLEKQIDTSAIRKMEQETKEVFRRFKEYYPAAVFPTTYFVVGIMNTGGTASDLGLFIGIDIYSRSDEMPTEELNDWQKEVFTDYSGLPNIVSHELMHFQQQYRDSSSNLLAKTIMEGACDFLAKLCQGIPDEINNKAYYEANQEMLWREFKQEMWDQDHEKWIWNGGWEDRPADLGYTLGHLISKGYYERAPDKKQAIWELLNTDSFQKIWEGSGYAD